MSAHKPGSMLKRIGPGQNRFSVLGRTYRTFYRGRRPERFRRIVRVRRHHKVDFDGLLPLLAVPEYPDLQHSLLKQIGADEVVVHNVDVTVHP